jgi:DNA replication protein DnaC
MISTRDIIGQNSIGKSVNNYVCSGCGEDVEERELPIIGGPDKGKMGLFKYGCKCADLELAKQAKEERKKAEIKKMMDIFDTHSLINGDLQKASFENFEIHNENLMDAYDSAMEFVTEFDIEKPKNLLFYGPAQVGKSHLSVSIAKELQKKAVSTVFISFPKLLTKIKGTYRGKSEETQESLLNWLRKVDVLILDDLGAEKNENDKDKAWSDGILWEIVDDRLGKHTVYTSNLSDRGLEVFYHERTLKRILKRTDRIIVQDWE